MKKQPSPWQHLENYENPIFQILVNRDGMSPTAANLAIKEAKHRVQEGEDPEMILDEEFGLEPDYIFDLI